MDIQKVIIVIIALILGLVASNASLPLATNEKIYIPSKHTPETVTLTPETELKQRIIAMPGTYSGLVLYSSDENFFARGLNATIYDQAKNISASGNHVKASFPPDSDKLMRLTIATEHFTITKPTHLFIHISTLDQQNLSLKVSALNQQLYASGELSINGTKTSRDLALSLLQPAQLSHGTRQGILAGAIFILGLVLIQLIPHPPRRWLAATLLIVVITPLALAGYWFSDGPLGIADWDYYFPLHNTYRHIVLQLNQFPFWNPYTCGGTAGLGDPEFPFFTPTFLLELAFGIPIGARLAIYLSVIVGATGMLYLAKRLRLSLEASLLTAITVAFSTVNLLEITEGHVNIFAAMWIPWIFWAWLITYRTSAQDSATRSIRRPGGHGVPPQAGRARPSLSATATPGRSTRLRVRNSWGLVTGLFLALTFYQGGIYLLMYTTLAFILLPFLVSRPRDAIVVTLKAGLWALGLAAVKLVPVLFWLIQFPDDAFASSTFTLPWITEILFGRHLHGSYIIPNQDSGWHEYGAYIGYIVFGLALIGASRFKKSRLVKALVIATTLAILLSTLGPYLKPIFDHLWFFPRSNISRFILFAVIPIALLAGIGLDSTAKWRPTRVLYAETLLLALLPGLVAIDLFSLAYPLSEQAFILPEVYPAPSPAPLPLAFITDRYDMQGQGSRTTRTFPAARAGYGTFAYCSVLGPKPAVRTIYDEEDNDILSVSNKSASYQLTHWSPNKVIAEVTTQHPTKITLNTNYAEGWTASGKPAQETQGRVSTNVASSGPVTFHYHVPGFRLGLAVSLLFSLAAIYSQLSKRLGPSPPSQTKNPAPDK